MAKEDVLGKRAEGGGERELREDLDFKRIINFQVNRCNRCLTSGEELQMNNSVMVLESNLSPYLDDEYFKEDRRNVNALNLEINGYIKKIKSTLESDRKNAFHTKIVALKSRHSLKKYSALIKLMHRKNLLLEEETTVIE